MRPVLAADLLLLVRAIMVYPNHLRPDAGLSMMTETDVAEAYFLTHHKNHPQFGDGSLMSRALASSPVPEPVASDPEFLDALETAVCALRQHLRS